MKKFQLSEVAKISIVMIVILCLSIGLVIKQKLKDAKSEAPLSDTLNIGMIVAPTDLDIRHTAGVALDRVLLDNVYEGLFTIDEFLKPVPKIVDRYSVDEQEKKYRFTLKQGMHFSDMTPFNAYDVKRCLEITKKEQAFSDAKQLESIDSINVIDEDTLEIQLHNSDPQFLWALAGRAGIVFPPSSHFPDSKYKTSALGSGPYIVDKYEDGKSIVLKENKNYYFSEAELFIKTINIYYSTDIETSRKLLKDGKINILTPAYQQIVPDFKNNKNYTVEYGENADKYEMAYNNKHEILKNKEIRSAISMAIDSSQIIKSRKSDDIALGGPVTKMELGYEDLTAINSYNPDKASQIIEQYGYNKDNPLKLSLKYTEGIYGKELGDLIKEQLALVNIDLDVINLSFNQWISDVYTKKDYDLTVVDIAQPYTIFNYANPNYYYNYDNKEVQNILEEAKNTLSTQDYDQKIKEAANIISNDAVCKWLLNYRVPSIVEKNIVGFRQNFTSLRMPFADISFTD